MQFMSDPIYEVPIPLPTQSPMAISINLSNNFDFWARRATIQTRCVVFTVKMPSRLCSIVSNLPITLLLSFSSLDAACLIFKVNILLFGVRAARLFHGKFGWSSERHWNDSGDKPIVGWHFFKASSWSLSRRLRISRSRCRCHWSYLKIN